MSSNASVANGSASSCAWKTLRLVEFAECSFPSELLRLVLAVSGAPHETAAEHVEKEDFYRATVRMPRDLLTYARAISSQCSSSCAHPLWARRVACAQRTWWSATRSGVCRRWKWTACSSAAPTWSRASSPTSSVRAHSALCVSPRFCLSFAC